MFENREKYCFLFVYGMKISLFLFDKNETFGNWKIVEWGEGWKISFMTLKLLVNDVGAIYWMDIGHSINWK